MYFKDVLKVSGAIKLLSNDFNNLGFSIIWLSILMPFIIGLLTGITVAFVGMTFPILLSLSGNITFLPLAYASGYIGVLISPTHLCLVLTRQYFNSNFSGIYKRMILPIILVFITSLVIFFFSRKGF